jgi:hypothetical protein
MSLYAHFCKKKLCKTGILICEIWTNKQYFVEIIHKVTQTPLTKILKSDKLF